MAGQGWALVTGGGGGIGAALSAVLADRGWSVLVTDRDAHAAEDVASRLAVRGATACAAALDVRDAEAFDELVASHEEERGEISLLVNNAGIGLAGEVHLLTLAHWKRVIDVNLSGVVHGLNALYPRMVARGRGRILNVASGAGLLPRPGMVPYAATKAAVVGLSLSLAPEARAHGVSVHVACPGYVQTGIMQATDYVGLDGDALARKIPIQPISAETCAKRIVRGMMSGRVLLTVSGETTLEWLLYRLSPALWITASQLRMRALRAASTPQGPP